MITKLSTNPDAYSPKYPCHKNSTNILSNSMG